MQKPDKPIYSYEDADEYLGDKQTKVYAAANTKVIRVGEDQITIQLYHTPIVTYFKSGKITLTSGGHRTKLTRSRINDLLPHSWVLYSRRNEWYLEHVEKDTIKFEDGVDILP